MVSSPSRDMSTFCACVARCCKNKSLVSSVEPALGKGFFFTSNNEDAAAKGEDDTEALNGVLVGSGKVLDNDTLVCCCCSDSFCCVFVMVTDSTDSSDLGLGGGKADFRPSALEGTKKRLFKYSSTKESTAFTSFSAKWTSFSCRMRRCISEIRPV